MTAYEHEYGKRKMLPLLIDDMRGELADENRSEYHILQLPAHSYIPATGMACSQDRTILSIRLYH